MVDRLRNVLYQLAEILRFYYLKFCDIRVKVEMFYWPCRANSRWMDVESMERDYTAYMRGVASRRVPCYM